jgi:hypothetical protein
MLDLGGGYAISCDERMTEEPTPPAEAPQTDGKSKQPSKARRISTVRVKKVASAEVPLTAAPVDTGEDAGPDSPRAGRQQPPSPVEREVPSARSEEEIPETSEAHEDWIKVQVETVGGTSSSGGDGPKRKRKRRRGKGGSSSDATEQPVVGAHVPAQSTHHHAPQKPRMVEAELLAKSAWKIFLAEISEEGVALVGDHDARDLARRCFRLAEIFHEEQARRGGI